MDYAPIVCVEQAALIFQRLVQHRSIDRNARVVDPRVESPETPDSFFSYVPDIIKLAHVAGDVACFSTLRVDFVSNKPERFFVSRVQHHTRAALRRHARSYKPDS